MDDTGVELKGKAKKTEKKEGKPPAPRRRSATPRNNNEQSEDDIADYEAAFALLDIDDNGEITKADLEFFIKSQLGEEPTETELQEMVTEVDVDGNGSINFTEFYKLMKEITVDPEAEQDMLDAFLVFDTERQGYISAEVLKHVMMNTGESLTEEESEDFIELIDADGDGLVNYQELVKILSN